MELNYLCFNLFTSNYSTVQQLILENDFIIIIIIIIVY
jgi:hypothetical protein